MAGQTATAAYLLPYIARVEIRLSPQAAADYARRPWVDMASTRYAGCPVAVRLTEGGDDALAVAVELTRRALGAL
ncbi:hypothetical protein [Streptomyces sp. ISL-100]|uniref:hypothetical protein n=1 Tax=Streptomyces sp. ISL-100 TaxID=2819173 RepID=UPI001BE854DA|nr:hypothetical protein [Streptomyces sp. ISL-100]MBT2396005.1 hypothetical protein [Streptomyces sp. ISL-100]